MMDRTPRLHVAMLNLESLRAHFGTMTTIATHKAMPRLDRDGRAFIVLTYRDGLR